MNGKYTNFIICFITLLFLIEFFDHTNILITTFYETSSLWFYNLIPTIFPFFIITDILSNYGFINIISNLLGKIMKCFNLPSICAYPFFMSMFSGFPGNSKLIKDLLDNKKITIKDANKLLTFTHFSNPLFIIGTVGTLFLRNKKMGILILLCHFSTNFIIGFIFNYIYNTDKNDIFLKNDIKKEPFIKLLINAINKTIKTLFIIYGIIIFFSLLTNILSINLQLPNFYKALLNGFLEVTKGLNLISLLNINIIKKATLMTFFLSFGGISIHLQIMGILSNYKINYFNYFIARILHAAISSLLIYFILKIIID